jgi:uroporphyrinogen-III synthase
LAVAGAAAILYRPVMSQVGAAPLAGLTVAAFESRRAAEMAELIRRHGGTPLVAPSMRESPLAENAPALDLLQRLEERRVDIVVLLTGVGTRALVQAVAKRCPPERFAELLRQTTLVARGPKPVAALRELKLVPDVTAPEPNTWRELLAAVDASGGLAGRRVAVQEYGRTNDELIDGLQQRGAEVLRVPVYRWEMPEDLGPLENAARRWAAGEVDIALFTSARQVDHFLEIADRLGLREAVVEAARRVVVASIGPVCSAALRAEGFAVDIEPEHPRMGQLVGAVARRGPELLAAKR